MCKLIIAGTVRLDLPVALHGVQATRESFHFVGLDAQRRSKRVGIMRSGRRAKNAEDFFPARDGICVLAQKRFLLTKIWLNEASVTEHVDVCMTSRLPDKLSGKKC